MTVIKFNPEDKNTYPKFDKKVWIYYDGYYDHINVPRGCLHIYEQNIFPAILRYKEKEGFFFINIYNNDYVYDIKYVKSWCEFNVPTIDEMVIKED